MILFSRIESMEQDSLCVFSCDGFRSALLAELFQGNISEATALLKRASDAIALVQTCDVFGNTPLIVAAKLLASRCISFQQEIKEVLHAAALDDEGILADPGVYERSSIALWREINSSNNMQEMIVFMKLLLEKGSQVLACNSRGKSFFYYLLKAKAYTVVDSVLTVLEKNHRDILLKEFFPLFVAEIINNKVVLGDEEIKKLLKIMVEWDFVNFLGHFLSIYSGANNLRLDDEGTTLLHLSLRLEKEDIALMIINDYGLYWRPRDQKELPTPLHIAASKGYVRVAEQLIEKGGGVNVYDKNLQSPLHKAVIYGHVQMVDLLLRCGAETRRKDNEQKDALAYAKESKNKDIIVLLERHEN